MKTGRPKEQGSIRTDGGRAMLGVSKKTRERINKLAHDANMPVSEYLKKLAEAAEKQPTFILHQNINKIQALLEEIVKFYKKGNE